MKTAPQIGYINEMIQALAEKYNYPLPVSKKIGWPWTSEYPVCSKQLPDKAKWPKISIVTPSYNQGEFIEETIRSVLMQGYPNLEYIIIDGGSTDDSVDIIKKYSPWLKFWISENDDGQAAAIYKGFAYATGDIFGYINSDDLYVCSAFFRIASSYHQHLESDSQNSFYAAYAVENFGTVSRFITKQDFNPDIFDWIRIHSSLHQPGVFWSSELFWRAGPFDEKLHYAFDRKFFMTLGLDDTWPFCHEGPPIAHFRYHDNSKTHQEHDSGSSTAGFHKEFHIVSKSIEKKLRGQKAEYWWGLNAQLEMDRIHTMMKSREPFSTLFPTYIKCALTYPRCLKSRFFWGLGKNLLFR